MERRQKVSHRRTAPEADRPGRARACATTYATTWVATLTVTGPAT